MLISLSSCCRHSTHRRTYLNRHQRRLLDRARKNDRFTVLRLTILKYHSPQERSHLSDSYFEIRPSSRDPTREKRFTLEKLKNRQSRMNTVCRQRIQASNRCPHLGCEGIVRFPFLPPVVLSIKNDRFAFVNQCRVNTTAVQQPSRPMEDCIKWNMPWRQSTTLLAQSVF